MTLGIPLHKTFRSSTQWSTQKSLEQSKPVELHALNCCLNHIPYSELCGSKSVRHPVERLLKGASTRHAKNQASEFRLNIAFEANQNTCSQLPSSTISAFEQVER